MNFLSNYNLCGSEVVNPLSKNSFAIFSWAVAVGSKGGLMVPGAVWTVTVDVWAVAASMWDVTDSMWSFTASMWAVTAYMYAVQALCGLLHSLCGLL